MSSDRADALREDIDAGKDAVAAVLAVMRGDGEGFVAILNGTDLPRVALGYLAGITADLLIRSGITESDARQLLTDARRGADDFMLDTYSRPGGG